MEPSAPSPEESHRQAITEARRSIDAADAVLITAGAGMGVDSGLPDFRGDEGFWRAYPPLKELGISFSEMANPAWFDRDPNLAWGFYGHRLELYRRTVPHRGFRLLLELGRSKAGGYFVFTSNVDGAFQKSGFDSDRIVECHGSIHHLQCTRCSSDGIQSADGHRIDVGEKTFRAEGELPRCTRCRALLRPNILMFGDPKWDGSRSSAQEEAMTEWLASLTGKKLVTIECGAGTAIPTVRLLGDRCARRLGVPLIRINLREAEVPEGGIGLEGGALSVLSELLGGGEG